MSSIVLHALQTCFHEIKFIFSNTNKQTLSHKKISLNEAFWSLIK